MADKTITECDGCGKVVPKEETRNWLRITVAVEGHSGDGERISFCGWPCVGRYANRKTQERSIA